MRAVGPGVLTGWQAAILHELYRAHAGAGSRAAARTSPTARSSPSGCARPCATRSPLQAVKAHVAMVSDRYLTNTSVQRMAEHLRMLAPARRRAGRDRAVPPSRPGLLRPRRGHARRARPLLADRGHAGRARREHHLGPDPHPRRRHRHRHLPGQRPGRRGRHLGRAAGAALLDALRAVLAGEQTVDDAARAAARARPRRRRASARPKITVDNQLSDDDTVVEVKCPDRARPALPDHAHAVGARARHRERAHRHRDRPGVRHLLRARPRRAASSTSPPATERIRAALEQALDPAPLRCWAVTARRVRQWSDPVGPRPVPAAPAPESPHASSGSVVSLFAAGRLHRRATCAGPACSLLLAGLFDLLDGSLARASGQVTPFGAFLDSVIDRYSDLVVLLGIVVLFARTPNARGALVAMAGLVGSVMVSYTKARAESIGVECNVGFMERPERMICLIAGALLDLLEPALWVLAMLANITALQRIVFTRRMMRASRARLRAACCPWSCWRRHRRGGRAAPAGARRSRPRRERAWARARRGLPAGRSRRRSPRARRRRAAQPDRRPPALIAGRRAGPARRPGRRAGDGGAASPSAIPTSRLAPRALLMAATLAARAGDDAGAQAHAQAADRRAIPTSREMPRGALPARPVRRGARPARGRRARLSRADGAGADDRLGRRRRRPLAVLAAAGVPVPAADDRISASIAPSACSAAGCPRPPPTRRSGSPARRATRPSSCARCGSSPTARSGWAATTRPRSALELAIAGRRPSGRPALRLEQARLLLRGGKRERALRDPRPRRRRRRSEADAAEALWMRARALEDAAAPGRRDGRVPRRWPRGFPSARSPARALWRLGWPPTSRATRRTPRSAGASWSEPGNRAYRLPGALLAGARHRGRRATARRRRRSTRR